MKKYEFESSLSKEEIYKRIESRSKKVGIQKFCESPAFGDVIHRTNRSRNSFSLYCYCLIKGGKWFFGNIYESDGKTIITGTYRFPRIYLMVAMIVLAVPGLITLKSMVAVIGILLAAVWYGIMYLFSLIFAKKSREGVLRFIENNLL